MTIEEFNALPGYQQRVLIAKDVIKQINARKYVAQAGIYCNINDADFTKDVTDGSSAQVKNRLDSIDKCTVCAQGALFMSTIGFANAFQVRSFKTDPWRNGVVAPAEKVKERLSKVFDDYQQAIIETAFEGRDVNEQLKRLFKLTFKSNETIRASYNLLVNSLKDYYHQYDNAESRLLGIMRNIIRNDGTFVPFTSKIRK